MNDKTLELLKEISLFAERDGALIMNLIKDYQLQKTNYSCVLIPNMAFFDVCIVTDSLILRNSVGARVWGRTGVYVFKAKESSKIPDGATRHKNCPNKKEIQKNGLIYAGAASKSLVSRINDHFKGIDSKTLSLHINNDLKKVCCVFGFALKEEFKNYSKIIVPLVEKFLHSYDIYLGNKNKKEKEK